MGSLKALSIAPAPSTLGHSAGADLLLCSLFPSHLPSSCWLPGLCGWSCRCWESCKGRQPQGRNQLHWCVPYGPKIAFNFPNSLVPGEHWGQFGSLVQGSNLVQTSYLILLRAESRPIMKIQRIFSPWMLRGLFKRADSKDTEHPVKDRASYEGCGRPSTGGKVKLIKRQTRGDMLVVYRRVNCQKRSVRRSYLAFPINQEQMECYTMILKANEFKSDTSKIFSYMVHN